MRTQQSPRLPWIDAAKGIAIILVVMLHIYQLQLDSALWNAGEKELRLQVWRRMNVVEPIRMPLFFLVSGALAASALRSAWGSLLRKKTAFFYYLYVLWTSIHTLLLVGIPAKFDAVTWQSWLDQATYELGTIWYLWALALYFPLAKLLLSVPLLGIALGVCGNLLWQELAISHTGSLLFVPRNFLWFFVGALLARKLLQLTLEKKTLVQGAGFAVIFALIIAFKLHINNHGVFLVAAATGVYVAFLLVIALAKYAPAIAGVFARVGRYTLPVYVLHVPMITYWRYWVGDSVVPLTLTGVLLYQAILCAAIVALGCLLGAGMTRWTPWLLRLPRIRRAPVGDVPAGTPATPARAELTKVDSRETQP